MRGGGGLRGAAASVPAAGLCPCPGGLLLGACLRGRRLAASPGLAGQRRRPCFSQGTRGAAWGPGGDADPVPLTAANLPRGGGSASVFLRQRPQNFSGLTVLCRDEVKDLPI